MSALSQLSPQDQEITRSRLNVFAKSLGLKIMDQGTEKPGDHGYRLIDSEPKKYNLTLHCDSLEEVAHILRGIAIGMKLACRFAEATLIRTEHKARDLENDINRIFQNA